MKKIVLHFMLSAVIVFLAAACTTTVVGPSCSSQSVSLPLTGIPQQKPTSWCWVATAQTIMNVRDPEFGKISQCELLEKTLTTTSCCNSTDMPPPCWSQLGRPEQVFNKNWVIQQTTYKFDYKNKPSLMWRTATEEICQGRAFISAINIPGGAHDVVVTGYDAQVTSPDNRLRIYDPIDDDFFDVTSDWFFDRQRHIRDIYQIKTK